jgi:predicted Zn-dependent protease
MAEQAEDETYARRLERQVIRGICLLMGLDYSPNPESAMTWYSSLEELDQIGRNLDPPWLIRLQERARELGIPLDPESPYNMFREITEE